MKRSNPDTPFSSDRSRARISHVPAAHPREAVGQGAAPQVAAEVALHPRRDAPAHGVGLVRLGEEGLQVMLDHRVQGRLGGTAGAIDGTDWAIRRFCGGGQPPASGMGRGSGMRGHVPTHRKSVCCAMAASAVGRRFRRYARSRSPGVRARVGDRSALTPFRSPPAQAKRTGPPFP